MQEKNGNNWIKKHNKTPYASSLFFSLVPIQQKLTFIEEYNVLTKINISSEEISKK